MSFDAFQLKNKRPVAKPSVHIIGAGGHALSIIEVISRQSESIQLGKLIDLPSKVGDRVLNEIIAGTIEDLPKLSAPQDFFMIGIGQIQSALPRKNAFDLAIQMGFKPYTLLATNASIANHVQIGAGTCVLQQALVNTGVRIGQNCIINSKALIEHGTQIGNHTHISTGALINGDCVIGDQVLIGTGAIVLQGVHIPSHTIIGAGAVVLHSISENGVYVGNPARKIDVVHI